MTVRKYFNDRFYEDKNEGLLLYSLPEDTVRTEIGSSVYYLESGATEIGFPAARYEESADGSGETLYVAADYVKLFADYRYQTFTGPNRMQVYTAEYGDTGEKARIAKDTAVRYQGGVKSPILADVTEGARVTILEEMETWSKVKTEDAIIGYVENKRLEADGGLWKREGLFLPTPNLRAFPGPIRSIWHGTRWPERQEMTRCRRHWRIPKGSM